MIQNSEKKIREKCIDLMKPAFLVRSTISLQSVKILKKSKMMEIDLIGKNRLK